VNDMCIPENIGSVLYPMYTISGEVKSDKCKNINKNAFLDMGECQMGIHPIITDDGNT